MVYSEVVGEPSAFTASTRSTATMRTTVRSSRTGAAAPRCSMRMVFSPLTSMR